MSDDFSANTDTPRRQRVFWLVMAVVAAAVLIQLTMRPITPAGIDGRTHPAVGGKLISLHVEPLTGDADDVYLEDLKGSVTVVNFWGTWCPPCRQEFPHVVALGKKHGDRDDFWLLPVSYPGSDDVPMADLRFETMAFLRSQDADLPTYADPRFSLLSATVMALGDNGFGYPTTLVLDRDTTIRGVWQGYEPGMERNIDALVDELLDEPAPPADQPSAATT